MGSGRLFSRTGKALLALADGSIYKGISVGAEGVAVGEVVFNTSMSGYQEILTDPSYARQIINFTCPHIGNIGINSEDFESRRIYAAGVLLRDLSPLIAGPRGQHSLSSLLIEQKVVGIAAIDTRMLTRRIRNQGAVAGCLVAGSELTEAEAIQRAEEFPGLAGMDLAQEVTGEQRSWDEGQWLAEGGFNRTTPEHHIVVIDYGVKNSILRCLAQRGCSLTVVPAQTDAEKILSLKPDGIVLSNGPGDPEPCDYAIVSIRRFLELKVPLLGICLGYQLLALACGAETVKMKFGHHGANHPVRDLSNDKVLITSQNHGFAVAEESLPDTLTVTHKSLFDGTLQGIRHRHLPALGFQGHPEAGPGPHDGEGIFDQFINLVEKSVLVHDAQTN